MLFAFCQFRAKLVTYARGIRIYTKKRLPKQQNKTKSGLLERPNKAER